ncbi:hypothetical protein TDB9533_04369 [Thalassocella blandensis]|nr:hypothetical protein TDB9533_04369 [Thalassocella blandensis]
MNTPNNTDELKAKLLGETAKIHWKELLRFFAGGYTIEVQAPADLIEIAGLFVDDEAEQIKALMEQNTIRAVPDETAKRWLDQDAQVWAVVLAPWVLVQDISEK